MYRSAQVGFEQEGSAQINNTVVLVYETRLVQEWTSPTVYRLVERYHQEHPVNETAAMCETETQRDEAMSGETETASWVRHEQSQLW